MWGTSDNVILIGSDGGVSLMIWSTVTVLAGSDGYSKVSQREPQGGSELVPAGTRGIVMPSPSPRANFPTSLKASVETTLVFNFLYAPHCNCVQGLIFKVVRSSVTTKIWDGQPTVIGLVVRRTSLYSTFRNSCVKIYCRHWYILILFCYFSLWIGHVGGGWRRSVCKSRCYIRPWSIQNIWRNLG